MLDVLACAEAIGYYNRHWRLLTHDQLARVLSNNFGIPVASRRKAEPVRLEHVGYGISYGIPSRPQCMISPSIRQLLPGKQKWMEL